MMLNIMIKTEKNVITKLIDMIPSEPIPNFAFKNLGDLSFSDVSNTYGFSEIMSPIHMVLLKL